MKKLSIIAIIVFLIFLGCYAINYNIKKNIIKSNTTELINDIKNINVTSIKISSLTKFDWDEAYIFDPYQPKKYQELAMGKQLGVDFYKPNENETCIAFLKNKKVVCYIGGNVEKLGFDIVYYKKDKNLYYSYIKKSDELSFNISINEINRIHIIIE